MASLYIKDAATAERVTRVAARLGTTKTAALNRAIDALEVDLGRPDVSDARALLRDWQRRHPIGRSTGLEVDKAFYDSLYDDAG